MSDATRKEFVFIRAIDRFDTRSLCRAVTDAAQKILNRSSQQWRVNEENMKPQLDRVRGELRLVITDLCDRISWLR